MKALLFIAFVAGFANATRFYIYSCPLDSSGSSLSISNSKDCASGKRDIPYGIRHTYLQVGSTCYDWGNWNYPRHVDCDGSELFCCVQEKSFVYFGNTACASRINEFESAWSQNGRSYHVYSWNCQVYTNKLKEFLNTCASPTNIIG